MKHCKTLFVLAAAAIVMLTSGCARQTVHPVPIRYNFLDHIPDYDPMLLDTELLSEPHAIVPELLRGIDAGAALAVPIRYRFEAPLAPVTDPTFPGNDLVEMFRSAVTETDVVQQTGAAASTLVRIRLAPDLASGPDQDPMLLKAGIAELFKMETTPDPDPMLLAIGDGTTSEEDMFETALAVGYIVPKHGPVPIAYRFDLTAIPDYDPMLHQPESVAGAGSARRDASLAATSGKAATYR